MCVTWIQLLLKLLSEQPSPWILNTQPPPDVPPPPEVLLSLSAEHNSRLVSPWRIIQSEGGARDTLITADLTTQPQRATDAQQSKSTHNRRTTDTQQTHTFPAFINTDAKNNMFLVVVTAQCLVRDFLHTHTHTHRHTLCTVVCESSP